MMSRFMPVALEHASRLLNHGSTVLITSLDPLSGRGNIMAAAWSTPVKFTPPRIAIVVDKSTWSRELIERSGHFGIVVPGVAFADQTWAVGSRSGRDSDKLARYGIHPLTGSALGLPVIEEGCSAWLECRLLDEPGAQQKYDTLFGEVVSAAADEQAFINGRWRTDIAPQLRSPHHLGAGTFLTTGGEIAARPLAEAP